MKSAFLALWLAVGSLTIDDLPISQPSWHTPAQRQQITAGVDRSRMRGELQLPAYVAELPGGSY